mmetsp:Transcript_23497/g.61934  ORF Transcript_23497/g.61934 Transcript_23497/m.61934 type:complete len:202 (+) Transcript_23497:172-777(+)
MTSNPFVGEGHDSIYSNLWPCILKRRHRRQYINVRKVQAPSFTMKLVKTKPSIAVLIRRIAHEHGERVLACDDRRRLLLLLLRSLLHCLRLWFRNLLHRPNRGCRRRRRCRSRGRSRGRGRSLGNSRTCLLVLTLLALLRRHLRDHGLGLRRRDLHLLFLDLLVLTFGIREEGGEPFFLRHCAVLRRHVAQGGAGETTPMR